MTRVRHSLRDLGSGAPPQWLLLSLSVLINLVWALTYPITKKMMLEISPLTLTCWRTVGAGIFLLPWFVKTLLTPESRRQEYPSSLRWRDVFLLGGMGLIGCALATWLQYLGTTRSLASNISLIVALETVLVVVLAAIFLSEKISKRSWIGLFFGLIGVTIISVDPKNLDLFSSQYFFGNFLMVLSIVCYGLYTLFGKILSRRFGSMSITVVPFLLSGCFLIPFHWIVDPVGLRNVFHLNLNQTLEILYLIIFGTGLSYLIWNWLLKWVPANELSRSLYFQPVAGVIFSCWLLGEKWSYLTILGAVAVTIGVVLSHNKESQAEF